MAASSSATERRAAISSERKSHVIEDSFAFEYTLEHDTNWDEVVDTFLQVLLEKTGISSYERSDVRLYGNDPMDEWKHGMTFAEWLTNSTCSSLEVPKKINVCTKRTVFVDLNKVTTRSEACKHSKQASSSAVSSRSAKGEERKSFDFWPFQPNSRLILSICEAYIARNGLYSV